MLDQSIKNNSLNPGLDYSNDLKFWGEFKGSFLKTSCAGFNSK